MAFTTDIKYHHFVSLTVHYICDSFRSCAFPDGPNTGAKIQKTIEHCCILLGLSVDVVRQCYFVTDNGSNIKLALSNFNRILRTCHMLASVLTHTVQLQSSSRTFSIAESSKDMHFVQQMKTVVSASENSDIILQENRAK